MKNIFIGIAVLFVVFFIVRKTTAQSAPEIGLRKFIELYQEHKVSQLLDVRTPQEYKYDGHIKGSRLVPLNEISSKGEAALPRLSKKQPVYIICRSGNRSLVAARLLQVLGFTQVYSVKGGMVSWIAHGQSVE